MKYVAIALAVALSTVACSGSDTAAPAPQPTVTVTETETVTVASSGAPQSCLDAIRYAREGFGVAGEFAGTTVQLLQLMQDSLTEIMTTGDVSTQSVVRMEAINQQTNEHNTAIQTISPKFISAANECENE